MNGSSSIGQLPLYTWSYRDPPAAVPQQVSSENHPREAQGELAFLKLYSSLKIMEVFYTQPEFEVGKTDSH